MKISHVLSAFIFTIIIFPSLAFADVGPDVTVNFVDDGFEVSNLTVGSDDGGVVFYTTLNDVRYHSIHTGSQTEKNTSAQSVGNAPSGLVFWSPNNQNADTVTIYDPESIEQMIVIFPYNNLGNFNFTTKTNAVSGSANWEPLRQDYIFIDFVNRCWGRDTIDTCTDFEPVPEVPPELIPFPIPVMTEYRVASTSCIVASTSSSCDYFYDTSTSTIPDTNLRFDGLLYMVGMLLLLIGIQTWFVITRKLS